MTEPTLTPGNLLVRRDELILLIHGYNVAETGAYDAYHSFLSRLGDPWIEMATAVYWPGDSRVTNPHVEEGWTYWFARFPSYSRQPKRARKIGRALADRLAEAVDNRKHVAFAYARLLASRDGKPEPDFRDTVAPTLRLSIIAHSMGCRLALELLDRLKPHLSMPGHRVDQYNREKPKPIEVKLVVFMAPAIPNYLIGESDEREEAFVYPEKVRVHYSRRDVVLLGAFPIGQSFESDEPRLPFGRARSALGRTGPSGRVQSVKERHGHGKYWTSTTIPGSVAEDLAKLHPDRLGIRTIEPVALQTRPQLAGRSAVAREAQERLLSAA